MPVTYTSSPRGSCGPKAPSRSLSLEPLDLPPLPLRRPALSFITEGRSYPELLREPFPHASAFDVLEIQGGGGRRRAAVLGQPSHANHVFERPPPDAQLVADGDRLGALRPGAIDLDPPGADRRGRERPRLEEARRPQPPVQPDPHDIRH